MLKTKLGMAERHHFHKGHCSSNEIYETAEINKICQTSS